jgi:hypothetical protein
MEGSSPAASKGMSANTFMAGAAGIGAFGSIMAGLFGYMAGENAAETYRSRARMIRAEAENEAQRYQERAEQFRATQAVAYLKSGVELSGSPLDVLDETIRVGRENASAIRSGGQARALDAEFGGEQASTAGRNALVSGVTGAAKTAAYGAYSIYRNKEAAKGRNNSPTGYLDD